MAADHRDGKYSHQAANPPGDDILPPPPPQGLIQVLRIRRHSRLQLAAQPLNAPQRPQIAVEPLQGTDHRKQPHSPHPPQEHLYRPAALPKTAKLQDRPDNNQQNGDQSVPPESPQLILPGQTQGRGICKQLRRLGIGAGIDPIVPQDTGGFPPHLPVSFLPLTLGVIGLCPQGFQPIPELPGLRRLKLPAAIARKRHRPPALDSFFFQPPLQKGGVPIGLRHEKTLFHGASSLLPGSSRSAARSSRSPSATQRRRRESSCRNRARPRSVMA